MHWERLPRIDAGRVSLKAWLYRHLFGGVSSPYNASLLYALAYVLALYSLAWLLYRKKWLIRV